MINKIFIILVIIVAVFGIATAIVFKQPASQPELQPLPTQPAKEANILVFEPKPDSIVGLQFDLYGLARVFENALNYEVRDGQTQEVIAKNFLTALSPDIGQFGPYAVQIKIAPAKLTSRSAILEVFNYSAKDGSKENVVVVPLIIDPTITTVSVFFSNEAFNPQQTCELVFARTRQIPATQGVARAALEELLKGPTDQEKGLGYFTSIPQAVRINSLQITNGTARIDFNEKLDQGVAGSCRVAAIRSQIEETLKQFPTVKNVVISRNGDYETVLQP